MGWDGSGNFSRARNWQNDEAADIDMLSANFDEEDDNFATGINACLTKNGETKPTADFRPNATRTYALGSTALRWTNAYLSGSVNVQSATAAAATTIAFTDATSARTITIPDATGTVSLLGVAETVSGDKTFSGNNTFSGDNTWTGQNVGLFSTGDVKLTFKTTADTGWVIMNDGSIGSATSGATTRANADTEDLYTLLWTNVIDAWAPVSTGRGASAAADFAANKTLTLPRTLGRALAISGAGASLTSRALGEYLGAETHTITSAEMPSHAHRERLGGAAFQTAGGDTIRDLSVLGATTGGGNTWNVYAASSAAGGADVYGVNVTHGGSPTAQLPVALETGNAGSGTAHNNMPPESFFNVMIKL